MIDCKDCEIDKFCKTCEMKILFPNTDYEIRKREREVIGCFNNFY